MNKSRKYRLLKNISSPDLLAKEGDIGFETKSDKYGEENKVWFDNSRYFFYISTINKFPDWFQLIEDEENEDSFEAVCISMETVMKKDEMAKNGLWSIAHAKDLLKELKRNGFIFKNQLTPTTPAGKGTANEVMNTDEKLYTEKELLDKENKAFKAGRLLAAGFGIDHNKFYKYESFYDYKNSKP